MERYPIIRGIVVCLAVTLLAGIAQGEERSDYTPRDARSELVATAVTTSMRVSGLTPLPPGLSFCDSDPCASTPPLVIYVCPVNDPQCTPMRSTTITPQLDSRAITGISLSIFPPNNSSLRLVSGRGAILGSVVWDIGSKIIIGSDEDIQISHFSVVPVWGGTTRLNFESSILNSTFLESVFYSHASYEIGPAAIDLHTRGQKVIMAERATSGLFAEPVTALYLPPEMNKDGLYGGNLSYGNGTVSINYGSPEGIARKGGIVNGAIPLFAHEYAHELFNVIKHMFLGDSSCLNEGIADALAFSVGFIPEEILGPIATDRVNFDSDCSAVSEIHDVGNCYFWHVKKAGLLTPQFLYGIFHPQHTFSFNSCDQKSMTTGNSILVYFTEAAGGANMVPVVNSMNTPHAGSYEAAKQALGFR